MLFRNLFVSDCFKRSVITPLSVGCEKGKALPTNLGNYTFFSDTMARDTQKNGIVRIVAKLRSFNPRLDMMDFHPDSLSAAILTSARIACPNAPKKFLVLSCFPIAGASAASPVRVICSRESAATVGAYLGFCLVRGRAALNTLELSLKGFPDFHSRLRGHFATYTILVSLRRCAHLRSRFGGLGGVAVWMIDILLSAFSTTENTRFSFVDSAFKRLAAILANECSSTHITPWYREVV